MEGNAVIANSLGGFAVRGDCASNRLHTLLIAFVIIVECARNTAALSSPASAGSLDAELRAVSEEYLSAIVPRPDPNTLPDHVKHELERRKEIVRVTWPDYEKGRSDAEAIISEGSFVLKSFAPLNYVEQEYARRLDQELGVRVAQVSQVVTSIHEWIYIYGYNSTMQAALERKYGKEVFWRLRSETVKLFGLPNEICRSDFFVPYRFGFVDSNFDISAAPKVRALSDRRIKINDEEDIARIADECALESAPYDRADCFKELVWAVLARGAPVCDDKFIRRHVGVPYMQQEADNLTLFYYRYSDRSENTEAWLVIFLTNGYAVGVNAVSGKLEWVEATELPECRKGVD